MKTTIQILVFSLSSLLWSSFGWAQPAQVDVLGPNWTGLIQEDGKGVYLELLHLIYDPLNIKIERKVMPWRRAEQELAAGRGDLIVSEYRVPTTQEQYLFPDMPLDTDEVSVLYMKRHGYFWKDEDSFEGRKIAWIIGYNIGTRLKQSGYTLQEVIDLKSGVQMLESGRIDYLLDYEPQLSEAMHASGFNPNDFESKKLNRIEKLYAAFAKTDNAKALLAIYNDAMIKLLESGKLDEIYKKYNYVDYQKTVNF